MSIKGFFEGIGSVFSFKEAFQKVVNAENINMVLQYGKEQIIEQIKENIPGPEKMDKVVENVTNFVQLHLHSDNKLVQWLIDTFLITAIRPVLQGIYDDLKNFVEGLTVNGSAN